MHTSWPAELPWQQTNLTQAPFTNIIDSSFHTGIKLGSSKSHVSRFFPEIPLFKKMVMHFKKPIKMISALSKKENLLIGQAHLRYSIKDSKHWERWWGRGWAKVQRWLIGLSTTQGQSAVENFFLHPNLCSLEFHTLAQQLHCKCAQLFTSLAGCLLLQWLQNRAKFGSLSVNILRCLLSHTSHDRLSLI